MPERKSRFARQESWRLRRVRESWRRPKGVTSRMRKEKAGWPRKVKVGYGTSFRNKTLHPTGLYQRIVGNARELMSLSPKLDIVVLSRRLSERKRLLIAEKAKELGLRVANPGKREASASGWEEPTEKPTVDTATEPARQRREEEPPEASLPSREETVE